MKYKALILDLDGTVVPQGSENPPSIRVSNAIAKAKNKIHVSVATGRPLFIARHVIDHLLLTGPCVLNNGTQIYDPVKNVIIKSYPLDQRFLAEVFNIFRKYPYKTFFFDGVQDVICDWINIPSTVMSAWMNGVKPIDVKTIMDKLQKISSISVHKMPAMKVEGCYALEVTNAQATKLHGIAEIVKMLHITNEEVIGVGDSYNDFPLLMASGLKIAMGDAVPELKAIADFVAPSVEEDGVATVIEKFILSAFKKN